MLNPVLTPEYIMMINQGDIPEDHEVSALEEASLSAAPFEMGCWAEEAMSDDPTPMHPVERKLRKQGLRKWADGTLPEVHDLRVEVFDPVTRKPKRVRVLRQDGGDLLM